MTEKSMLHKIELSILIALILSIFVGIDVCSASCKDIRENIFRLHVIANSDSHEDQQLKLAVRDRIISTGGDIFAQVHNKEDAEKTIRPFLPEIQRAAEDVIREQGYDYPVKVMISNEYFNTRVYEAVTLPAGRYDALRVVIGSGEGKNWWCVMFPPMCLPAAEETEALEDVLSEEDLQFVSDYQDYEIRFKVIEWYENLKNTFNIKITDKA